MHTDLSTHLHTPECNILIVQLKECHTDYPIRKFIGYCNSIDHLMTKCLKKERLARKERNSQKARENKLRAVTSET